MGTSYVIRRIVIDGEIIDRDEGHPDLELEMHPIGTMLPREQQGRRLRVRIGRKETWLDADGIKDLRDFLEEDT